MAFEEIKAGLEKYCKKLEEKLKNSETLNDEDVKMSFVLELIRKQSPRVPQNIVLTRIIVNGKGVVMIVGK